MKNTDNLDTAMAAWSSCTAAAAAEEEVVVVAGVVNFSRFEISSHLSLVMLLHVVYTPSHLHYCHYYCYYNVENREAAAASPIATAELSHPHEEMLNSEPTWHFPSGARL